MHLNAIVIAILAATVSALPGYAQSEEDAMAEIESLHGKSVEFGEAFGLLQDAFLFDDPTTIADLGAYPFEVAANGELYDMFGPDDLLDNFDVLVTQDTIDAISSQDYADLIVTSDGVGFGDGALWMSLVCVDDSCSDSYWGIIRINN